MREVVVKPCGLPFFSKQHYYMNIFQQKAKEQAIENAKTAKIQSDLRKKRDLVHKKISSITGVTPKKELFGFHYKTKSYTLSIHSLWCGIGDTKYKWDVRDNKDAADSCTYKKGKMVCTPRTPINYDKFYAELTAELTKKTK